MPTKRVGWRGRGMAVCGNLQPAQAEFVELCRAIYSGGAERLRVIISHESQRSDVEKALAGLDPQLYVVPFGDIWVRDTAPIFVHDQSSGSVRAHSFAFNGWGGKYCLEGDNLVSERVARQSQLEGHRYPWVLEGGSVEVDGEGTCLTTRQCLLNPNRNPSLSKTEIEEALYEALGAVKTLWLGDGLLNDHTDGHIDTVARFVGPGKVVCMEPAGADDPNADVLRQIRHDLESFTDAQGRRLEVLTIPSPGRILDEEGEIMPASYVNFYIANASVVVPTYGVNNDARAVETLAKIFPGRRVVGCSARAILSGGGAFHCITQQQPRALSLGL